MIAPESERPDVAGADELVQPQRNGVPLAKAEPADPGRQPLQRHPRPRELDPGAKRVRADNLHDGVLALVQVLPIARERDPAKRANATGKDRADVRLDETGDPKGLRYTHCSRLRAQAVPVLEDDRAAVPEADQRLSVRAKRAEDGVLEEGVVRVCVRGRRGRVAGGHVGAEGVVGRRLVGDDVELDSVGEEAGHYLARVAHEPDCLGPVRVEVRCERLVVARCHDTDPALPESSLRPSGIHLDDQSAAAVQGDAKALRSAHSAETCREHAPAGERAAEMLACDRAEGLVGEAEDPLRADIEPTGRGHLPVHGQAGVLEPAEALGVRPRRHDHRRRDEDARGVQVSGQDGDGLARLDDQRLVVAEPLEGSHDCGKGLRIAGCLAATAVDDERLGVLGHLGIEIVEKAAERAFLLPAATPELASARRSYHRRILGSRCLSPAFERLVHRGKAALRLLEALSEQRDEYAREALCLCEPDA